RLTQTAMKRAITAASGPSLNRANSRYICGLPRRSCHVLGQPVAVHMRRNLRWLDLAASAPENVRVREGKAAGLKMPINGRLVIEWQLFIEAMRHSHDVDVLKFCSRFAPVAMR